MKIRWCGGHAPSGLPVAAALLAACRLVLSGFRRDPWWALAASSGPLYPPWLASMGHLISPPHHYIVRRRHGRDLDGQNSFFEILPSFYGDFEATSFSPPRFDKSTRKSLAKFHPELKAQACSKRAVFSATATGGTNLRI